MNSDPAAPAPRHWGRVITAMVTPSRAEVWQRLKAQPG
jgi:hypothetical protein